ncbi:DNA replication licensing factor MCM3 [Nematocida displodere]|uniref:DNA replication licensing factor MCM3 n=1 Tax=Nematocida displodere TaxID=1805483 RepID=A0A177EH90_9MICR|nr:DNA replication licensing factor MCM3 [Nematocida displodere]
MDAIAVHRAQIREFFERAKGERRYKTELLTTPQPRRVVVALGDIRKFSKDLAHSLKENAISLIPAFEEIAAEISQCPVSIGFSGVVGGEKASPRTLLSHLLGKLVCIEGIVTSASIVRPKLRKSIHYNKETHTFAYKDYRDMNALSTLPPTTTVIPTRSLEGCEIDLEYGLSEYTSHQTAVLQEMPELSPPGQMPRGVTLVFEDDLAASIKPGDRVRVYGTYKCISHIRQMPEMLKTSVIVNNVEFVAKRSSSKEESLESIKTLVRTEGLEGIAQFIAPSIYGHAQAKKAILLLMIGGTPVDTQGGGRIRGDINILMVGDPGIAKSQLLRYVMEISPLAIGTTGRGASGVGLTAAVVTDADTGSRRVEAGAMVLADTGIVCIDEFDKMDEAERAAIHEAMEQQTVTIAKGGIHTTLNARCSVLAAANPVTGQYRATHSPKENIRLPESLLTRFDLIFIMEDTSEYDAEIAEHVLNRRMGKETQIAALTQEEIKMYILKAREIHPTLTEEAIAQISQEYLRLRKEGEKLRNNLSRGVTARLLESIIRLATAHAKSRFSSVVEVLDADAAIGIIEPTLWRKPAKHAKAAVPVTAATLLDVLFAYRENNPFDQIVSLEKILSLCTGERDEVIQGLKELEKDSILSLSDGMVIFS